MLRCDDSPEPKESEEGKRGDHDQAPDLLHLLRWFLPSGQANHGREEIKSGNIDAF
jgi:hypothetical protein